MGVCNHLPSVVDDYYPSTIITVPADARIACIDFTNLVVDDDILEGNQSFTIHVRDSMSVVTIIDNDGE